MSTQIRKALAEHTSGFPYRQRVGAYLLFAFCQQLTFDAPGAGGESSVPLQALGHLVMGAAQRAEVPIASALHTGGTPSLRRAIPGFGEGFQVLRAVSHLVPAPRRGPRRAGLPTRGSTRCPTRCSNEVLEQGRRHVPGSPETRRGRWRRIGLKPFSRLSSQASSGRRGWGSQLTLTSSGVGRG